MAIPISNRPAKRAPLILEVADMNHLGTEHKELIRFALANGAYSAHVTASSPHHPRGLYLELRPTGDAIRVLNCFPYTIAEADALLRRLAFDISQEEV